MECIIMPPSVREKVNDLHQQLLTGNITVSDFLEERDKEMIKELKDFKWNN